MQTINMQTPGLHHLALRVSNLEHSKDFYINKLGFQKVMEQPNLCIILAGQTPIGLRGPESQTPEGDCFDPFRVGLDHIAVGCTTQEQLEEFTVALDAQQIENTGIKFDEVLGKNYVAFKDPDRISWEYYMI